MATAAISKRIGWTLIMPLVSWRHAHAVVQSVRSPRGGLVQRIVKESWPWMRPAFFPLPARGLGTLPTLARQRPKRLLPRSSWLQLQGREWWVTSNLSTTHAKPLERSVAYPPVVPPVDALRHWRTQKKLRQEGRRGARTLRPHSASSLRPAVWGRSIGASRTPRGWRRKVSGRGRANQGMHSLTKKGHPPLGEM